MSTEPVTVVEWRDKNLPHFTACEEHLTRYLESEIRRVAGLLDLDESLFIKSSRVKEARSAASTAERRGQDYWKLPDWVGLRVSCPTLEAAYFMSVVVNGLDDWRPGRRFDYNLEPKLDGYRGVHVYGAIERGDQEKVVVNCEIQLHSRLQTLWSDLTHDEVYKPDQVVSLLAHDTSSNLASYMAATDQLIERMLKILAAPESQMKPPAGAEMKHWIATLAILDPSLDPYDLEELSTSLQSQGLRELAQLGHLRERFPRLKDSVTRIWKEIAQLELDLRQSITIAARLIVEHVGRNEEDRKIATWAREYCEASAEDGQGSEAADV